jgi:hypothetical protein
MGHPMEAKNERIDEEPGEEEELDVSNLLVTKSERAPQTESPPIAREKSRIDLLKTTALAALGSIALAAAAEVLRRLIFARRSRPRDKNRSKRS